MINLDPIKRRAEKATEGPWVSHVDGSLTKEGLSRVGDIMKLTDGAFIAHAREDVPALVAEVEKLRGLLRRVLEADERFDEGHAISTLQEAALTFEVEAAVNGDAP